MTLEEKEEAKHSEAYRKEQERIKGLRAKDPLDAVLEMLKVGDSIKFCSDCYRQSMERSHGEVVELIKYTHTPDKEDNKSKYAGQAGTYYFAKVKDHISKSTYVTLAELIEKI